MMKRIALLLICGSLGGGRAAAQTEHSPKTLSRQMKLGIRFYENREDTQAMDRFMDVLTHGDPAERPLANEYINLMNHRMNTSDKLPMPPRPGEEAPIKPEDKTAAASGPEVIVEPVEAASSASPAAARAPSDAVPAPQRAKAQQGRPPAKSNKAAAEKEIKAKIRILAEKSLKRLKGIEGLQVIMLDSGNPSAIAVPSEALFQSGLSFRKSAAGLLEAITGLAFSLSHAQISILPEGTAAGGAKILDMRRTMGISSYLFSAGVAPARVKVNLLNNLVEIPRHLQEFKGIIMIFAYDQPLGLVVESAIGDEAGPPVSLGVFPESFRPDTLEGTILEFSVQEPPAGLASWEFKLLQPSADGGDLAPLQQAVGSGPVFHQIFWNGRENYFGPSLAPGRYECVLTAVDGKNRRTTLHRWIHLLPAPSAEPSAASPMPASAKPKSQAPSADLPREETNTLVATLLNPAARAQGVEIVARKAVPRPKKKKKIVRNRRAAPRARRRSAASQPAATQAKRQDLAYQVTFYKDKDELTPGAEKTLAQAAETAVYYPMENIDVVGYAHVAEADANALALKRAQAAAALLTEKYKVEPKRIKVNAILSDALSYRAEIRFIGNE